MNASKHPWGQYGLVNLCVPPVSLAEVFFFCFMFFFVFVLMFVWSKQNTFEEIRKNWPCMHTFLVSDL